MISVSVTSKELTWLAEAIEQRARYVSAGAQIEPLRTQDPQTIRYELFDEARRMYERARELRSIAEEA